MSVPDRFTTCHAITAKWEGGWSDHKADPGGKTMYGITDAVYRDWLRKRGQPVKSVRYISMTEAMLIYREQYWNPTAVEFGLFPGVDLAVYDAAVNSGVSRGIKWLKASAGSIDHSETVKRICRARLSFMRSLAIWKTFGKGWGRRVADIEAKGVAMALTAMGLSTPAIKVKANKEAEAAKKQASTAAKTAAGTASTSVATGSAPVVEPTVATDTTMLWALVAVFVVGLLVTVFLIAKKRAADARAEAYAQVAA